MNKQEYSFVIGLLAGILSKVTDGGFHGLYAFFSIVFIVYAVIVEVATLVEQWQASRRAPFGMNMAVHFDTPDERSTFATRVNDVLSDMRREKDATNGLTEDQLADAGLDAQGQKELPKELPSDPAPSDLVAPHILPSDVNTATPNTHVRKQRVDAKAARKEAVKLYRSGLDVPQVADQMGYADATNVYRYLKAAGVKLRAK